MSVNPVGRADLEFDLADRMRRALRVAEISSNEMADYLGVSRTSVSAWINGRNEPRRTALIAWALRTGVPLEWLETGKAPTSPSGPEGEEYTSRDSNPEPADYESGVVVELDAYRRAAASTSEVAA